MEYIQRKKSSLEDLKKTNDEFNLLITSLTLEKLSWFELSKLLIFDELLLLEALLDEVVSVLLQANNENKANKRHIFLALFINYLPLYLANESL